MSEENEPNLVTIELKYVSKSNLSILLTLQLHGWLPLMNMGLLLGNLSPVNSSYLFSY